MRNISCISSVMFFQPVSARRFFFLTSFLIGVTCAGCAAPPDVSAFASATRTLHATVVSARVDVRRDLERAYGPAGAAQISQFEKAWHRREIAARAVADYARALTDVMNAGNDGAAAAAEVTGAVKRLLTNVRVDPVWTESAAGAARAVEILYREYAKQQAARTLAEALAQAQPTIRQLAVQLQSDTRTLRVLLDDARKTELTRVESHADISATVIARVDDDINRQMVLSRRADDSDRIGAELQRLLALKQSAATSDTYRRWLAERQTVIDRYQVDEKLLDDFDALLCEWANAHDRLADAARTRRPVDLQQLVLATSELLETYQEMRKK